MDRGRVVEPKKPWASSGCSVLTLCVPSYISLHRPPPSGPSRVFLAVKEVGSRGRRAGPGASEPLEAAGKLCLLVSRPVRDLIGKSGPCGICESRDFGPSEHQRGQWEHFFGAAMHPGADGGKVASWLGPLHAMGFLLPLLKMWATLTPTRDHLRDRDHQTTRQVPILLQSSPTQSKTSLPV
jgi:hypothetical protein